MGDRIIVNNDNFWFYSGYQNKDVNNNNWKKRWLNIETIVNNNSITWNPSFYK